MIVIFSGCCLLFGPCTCRTRLSVLMLWSFVGCTARALSFCVHCCVLLVSCAVLLTIVLVQWFYWLRCFIVAMLRCCVFTLHSFTLRFYVAQFYTAFLRRTVLHCVFTSHRLRRTVLHCVFTSHCFTPRFYVAQFYAAF